MEVSMKKLSTAGRVSAHKDALSSSNHGATEKVDNCTNRDRPPLHSRDLNESDRTTMIEDTVEKAISLESKHMVESILTQVRKLTPIEKLLLYLKLPNGRSAVDPLRQHMNPLGSRLEIHHTITWIKTHLQEDPEVSLPKQDVYEQYIDYCEANSVKPLSTADFGKVMKQVYPDVRPRRLGTRGHSRYCYAGLRKRMRLVPPLLPDLGSPEKVALEENGGGKTGSPERTLLLAVSVLIREWAAKTLGQRFSSLQELACHLVQNMAVNVQSTAALTVLSSASPPTPAPRSACHSRPDSSAASLASEGRPSSELSVNASRPSSETPRSMSERDHKRKMQDDCERFRLRNPDHKIRGKRTKHRSSSSPSNATIHAGRQLDSNRVAANPSLSLCDNSAGNILYPGMPYMNSKDGQADMQNNNTPHSNGSVCDAQLMGMSNMFSDIPVPEPAESICNVNLKLPVDGCMPSLRTDGGPDGKLPIPRLPKHNKNTMQNFLVFPPPIQQHSQKQKYKPIKPKPYPELEKPVIKCSGEDLLQAHTKLSDNSLDLEAPMVQNGILKTEEPMSRSCNDSVIGCLDKDSLDDYLHEGSNSQEQEEELMQYFPQQAQFQNQPMRMDAANSVDKISQLRLLLERNLNQDAGGKGVGHQNGLSAAASLSLLSKRSQQKQNMSLPSMLVSQQSLSRRVSFDVSCTGAGDPDSAASSVPPSPNTKQRFSFTPISPRPYSPTKSCSANASPFVSPRNTPVPRLKISSQPPPAYLPPASNHCSQAMCGKTAMGMGMPRTMMRSSSFTNEASFMPSQSSNQRSLFGPNRVRINAGVQPELQNHQEMNNCTSKQMNAYGMGCDSGNLCTPLHLTKTQFPISMSAPQSPIVHSSKSGKRIGFKEARTYSLEMDNVNNLHMQAGMRPQIDQLPAPFVETSLLNNSNFPDKYSQEISDLFSGNEPMTSLPSSVSSFRSQSVPLRRMVNSACMSPMPATALPSPHYIPPHGKEGVFNFMNIYTPSNSVAPTPVPSEMADFGVDSDVHPSTSNNMHGFESAAPGPNSDLLNEMFHMFVEGKTEGETQQSQQSGYSQSYPNTPLPFKADPETTLRGDPLFTAFHLQSGGADNGTCTEEQLTLGGGTASTVNATDPVLSELNSMANAAAAAAAASCQQEMNALLEEAPSSFITDELECEISQLAREVGDTQ